MIASCLVAIGQVGLRFAQSASSSWSSPPASARAPPRAVSPRSIAVAVGQHRAFRGHGDGAGQEAASPASFSWTRTDGMPSGMVTSRWTGRPCWSRSRIAAALAPCGNHELAGLDRVADAEQPRACTRKRPADAGIAPASSSWPATRGEARALGDDDRVSARRAGPGAAPEQPGRRQRGDQQRRATASRCRIARRSEPA